MSSNEVESIEIRPGYLLEKVRKKHKRHYNAYYKKQDDGFVFHRVDGPAVEYIPPYKVNDSHYLNGKHLSRKETKELIKYNKMTTEQLLYFVDNRIVQIILEERLLTNDDDKQS